MAAGTAQLLQQRSGGSVALQFGPTGVRQLREEGAAKLRLPAGSREALLINTSGGLAGGDTVAQSITVLPGGDLTVTSQAAERCYGSIGPPATVSVTLDVADKARLCWLPHETILFARAALQRTIDVTLAPDAQFTAWEAVVLGRTESAEQVEGLALHDAWTVRQDGVLLHADVTRLAGDLPATAATLAGNRAYATVLHVAPDAEQALERVRLALGPQGGASAWRGKLVARVLAEDGFALRNVLKRVGLALLGPAALPRTWLS